MAALCTYIKLSSDYKIETIYHTFLVSDSTNLLEELTPTKGEESGSRKIVVDNRCSGSKHTGTSIGHNRIRAFQGHSEHNN
ncbi:hypothetical protein HUJ05_003291 [Dendroctonus ponderosae]|nr:hypothetical protein HUJ05_003291 [Dendroctonus ponderosae]